MKPIDSLVGVKQVQETLGVSESKAYKVIAELNAELEDKGFLTIKGKVPKDYFLRRYGLKTGLLADQEKY